LPNEAAERSNDLRSPFTEEGGKDVLANGITPEMVAAVAARMIRRPQIDPMGFPPTFDQVPPITYRFAHQL
jgi:hypothetical protein